MKSKAKKIFTAVILMGLMAIVVSVDATKEWSKSTLDSISASAGERYKIEVVLDYEDDRTFTFDRVISRREYNDATFIAEELYRKYVNEAKVRLSKKLYYFDQLHGDSEALKIAQVKVRSVKVIDIVTDRETKLSRCG